MRRLLATAAASLAACVHAESYQVLPADPQAGETVAITLSVPPWAGATCVLQPQLDAQLNDRQIVVVVDASAPARPPGAVGWCRGGAAIALPQAGHYSVRVPPLVSQTNPSTLTTGGSVDFDVTASTESPPAWRGLDGNWFDPAQPGWGVNFVQGDSGALFAVLLTYKDARGTDGRPLSLSSQGSDWLVMAAGRWTTPTTFRGALFTTTNASFVVGAGAPAASAVGFATLQFADASHVKLSAQYLTPTGAMLQRDANLQRFSF